MPLILLAATRACFAVGLPAPAAIPLFVAAVALATLSACAPRAQSGGSAYSAWAADEARIRAATTASADAWNRGDLKGHLAIYVDSVTFMTRTGPRPGVAAIEQSFTTTYFRDGQPKQMLRFEQVTVRPLGRDAALETGRFILTAGASQSSRDGSRSCGCERPTAGKPCTITRADVRQRRPSNLLVLHDMGRGGKM